MDVNVLDSLGEAAKLFAGAALLANLLTSLYTLANPSRTPATAVIAALLFGMLGALLLALASALPLSLQSGAQVVIVGILAGAGAAGVKALNDKADQSRLDAKIQPRRRIKEGPIA